MMRFMRKNTGFLKQIEQHGMLFEIQMTLAEPALSQHPCCHSQRHDDQHVVADHGRVDTSKSARIVSQSINDIVSVDALRSQRCGQSYRTYFLGKNF